MRNAQLFKPDFVQRRHARKVLMESLAVSIIWSIQASATQTGGTILGLVLDERGEAVEGARISFQRKSSPSRISAGQSDDHGAFRVTGLETGEYLFSAQGSHLGLSDDTARAEISHAGGDAA